MDTGDQVTEPQAKQASTGPQAGAPKPIARPTPGTEASMRLAVTGRPKALPTLTVRVLTTPAGPKPRMNVLLGLQDARTRRAVFQALQAARREAAKLGACQDVRLEVEVVSPTGDEVVGPSLGLTVGLLALALLTRRELPWDRLLATGVLDAKGRVDPVGAVAMKEALLDRFQVEKLLFPAPEGDNRDPRDIRSGRSERVRDLTDAWYAAEGWADFRRARDRAWDRCERILSTPDAQMDLIEKPAQLTASHKPSDLVSAPRHRAYMGPDRSSNRLLLANAARMLRALRRQSPDIVLAAWGHELNGRLLARALQLTEVIADQEATGCIALRRAARIWLLIENVPPRKLHELLRLLQHRDQRVRVIFTLLNSKRGWSNQPNSAVAEREFRSMETVRFTRVPPPSPQALTVEGRALVSGLTPQTQAHVLQTRWSLYDMRIALALRNAGLGTPESPTMAASVWGTEVWPIAVQREKQVNPIIGSILDQLAFLVLQVCTDIEVTRDEIVHQHLANELDSEVLAGQGHTQALLMEMELPATKWKPLAARSLLLRDGRNPGEPEWLELVDSILECSLLECDLDRKTITPADTHAAMILLAHAMALMEPTTRGTSWLAHLTPLLAPCRILMAEYNAAATRCHRSDDEEPEEAYRWAVDRCEETRLHLSLYEGRMDPDLVRRVAWLPGISVLLGTAWRLIGVSPRYADSLIQTAVHILQPPGDPALRGRYWTAAWLLAVRYDGVSQLLICADDVIESRGRLATALDQEDPSKRASRSFLETTEALAKLLDGNPRLALNALYRDQPDPSCGELNDLQDAINTADALIVMLEASADLLPAFETHSKGRLRNEAIRTLNRELIRWNQSWLDHPEFAAARAPNHRQHPGAKIAVTNLVVDLLNIDQTSWMEPDWNSILQDRIADPLLDSDCLPLFDGPVEDEQCPNPDRRLEPDFKLIRDETMMWGSVGELIGFPPPLD
jgi:hypothetical protein